MRKRNEELSERVERLTEYCRERLGEGLRAVGFHTDSGVEVAYIRDELVKRYPPDRVEDFVDASRQIHDATKFIDDVMGSPEASLHVLEQGLIVQFHFAGEDVVFLSMERDVGRNFTRFVSECFDRMDSG